MKQSRRKDAERQLQMLHATAAAMGDQSSFKSASLQLRQAAGYE